MPANAGEILVIDDEPQIRRLLRVTLVAQGFTVTEASDAAEALKRLSGKPPDLVLLDLGLPDGNGLDLIEQVRRSSAVPIIVLSARSDEAAKVRALDLGADDYVTKPFGTAELLARIRTALRHRLHEQGSPARLVCGELTIDLVGRAVTRGGGEVKLTKTEFEILRVMAEHAGKILTHDFLLRAVWGPHVTAEIQYLRVYIRALRMKLEPDSSRPQLIRTETGIGYRLICDG